MNSIGNKLTNLRKQYHLSQEEAAEKLGVTRQTISKWETEESKPDFDKISLICDLYKVTPNELFNSKEEKAVKNELTCDNRPKKALGIGGGVFLYFIAIAWMTTSIAAFKINPVIATGIFISICGLATFIIVYVCLVYKTEKEEKKVNKLQKAITECLSIITCVIYFIISFLTMAWHITWIIWLIYGLIEEIVKLIFVLKEDNDEK